MVFTGLYPVESNDYGRLREALEKLQLNDASLSFEPETSEALGLGFRRGFLGLLHMDIIQERLEREFDLALITTAPNVIYRVNLTSGEQMMIENPADWPDPSHIASVEEPVIKASIITPSEYVGPLMELCQDRRGTFLNMEYLNEKRVNLHYKLPVRDHVRLLRPAEDPPRRGYASFDYEVTGYEAGGHGEDGGILLNGESVDVLSSIVHREKAQKLGRALVRKLRKLIPRHMFEVPIQAAVGNKILARREHRPAAQGCAGQVLRRRRHPQAEAARRSRRRARSG